MTVILTTHDLEDIARLCPRVVLIDHGHVIYDGALEALRTRFGRQRTLVVDLDQEVERARRSPTPSWCGAKGRASGCASTAMPPPPPR